MNEFIPLLYFSIGFMPTFKDRHENEKETSPDQWVRFEISFTNSIVYTPTPWLMLLLVHGKGHVNHKLRYGS